MTKGNKTAISLVLNSAMALFSFIVLMNTLSKGELWRIIFAVIGFIVFLSFSIALLNKWSKQRKSINVK